MCADTPEYKSTLNLPKTDFPMRAGLVKREPSRQAHWEKLNLYAAIQKKRAVRKCSSLSNLQFG